EKASNAANTRLSILPAAVAIRIAASVDMVKTAQKGRDYTVENTGPDSGRTAAPENRDGGPSSCVVGLLAG
ncbi:MAG: hypothetical protein J0I63_13760, partial [Thiobacillus sp.]|nr:hypothetical protein [Thiobacillus sp.]